MATGSAPPAGVNSLNRAVLDAGVTSLLGNTSEAALAQLGNAATSFVSSPAAEPDISRVERGVTPLICFVRAFANWVIDGFNYIGSELFIMGGRL